MWYRDGMTFSYRKRLTLGPLRLNFTQNGLSSVSIKLGPVIYNLKSKKTSVNLPGGASWRS